MEEFVPTPFRRSPSPEKSIEGVRALEEPLLRVLEGIREEIVRGSYTAIIGEDASGRVPALILGNAIGSIYQASNREKPIIRFVTGSRFLTGSDKEKKEVGLEQQVDRIADEAPDAGSFGGSVAGKLLLVTDIIESGSSITPLIDAVHANGLKADIATVSLITKTGKFDGLPLLPDETLVWGMEDRPPIFGSEASGVWKRSESLFAYPDTDKSSEFRQLLADSRRRAKEMADRLAEGFWQE